MSEKITIFHAGKSRYKTPISPYGDNTFVFETYSINTHLEFYSLMSKYFILNIPLDKLEQPTRTFRRIKNLDSYYHHCINYLILDIDDVHTEKDQKEILEYFKDYKVILGESKSFNGINNFRMKGVLFCDCIDFGDAKLALSAIHHDLKHLCTIDEAVANKVSLNAPINKTNIFINNESGKKYEFDKSQALAHIEEVKSTYLGEAIKFSDDQVSNLGDIEATSIEKLCLKVFQTMGFEAIKNNANDSISFKHPDEVKSPGGYFWFGNSPYTMHHFNSTKVINIFDTVRKLPAAKELMKQDIDYNSEFLKFNTDTNIISVDEKYLTLSDDVKESVQSFLTNKGGLFSIRSPMGTGKSTVINHIIEECHAQDTRVLIITNRISVANDFAKKYDIKVYNKDKYKYGDSLICQFDSLWRYDIKLFDVVIMDEFISLMIHSRSNLNNSSVNIAKFFASFNKKLVIADAFLTGYENFLIENKENNLFLLDNTYRDPTTLYNYTDMNYFVDSIILHSSKHKITVSSTSIAFIESLQLLLTNKGLKVVTLTASTNDTTKKLIYDLFEKNDHNKWDVLIFSPTLTVGVSNLNKVNYHFHYDSSMSSDVISSIQMIKRTRKTKEIHFLVKERIRYIKTSYNDIRDDYMTNIGKNINENYLFDVDDYGDARLSNIGKKAIKIDTFKNILEFNHSEAFNWLLKYHFYNEPRTIDTTFSGNVLSKYNKEIRENREIVLKNNINQFLDLSEMDKLNALLDTDKVLRELAEIEDCIGECNKNTKSKILECALRDKSFIDKCKYYKVTFNYTNKIWDDSDVKHLVSQSVINSKYDDLNFYNALLKYGRISIFNEYIPKAINNKKDLKSILDKCGYGVTKTSQTEIVGYRSYKLDNNVKELYGFIK